MSSALINWVNAYLEQDEDIVVPIKKLWNGWRATHASPSLAEFTALILADPRFEELPGTDHTKELADLSPDEFDDAVRDMETLDFYSGPRVKLKSRELTLEHITAMIKKHNDRMQQGLEQAYQSMPDDMNEQEEGQLLDIMALAKELREKLRQAGLETNEEKKENDAEDDKP